MSLPGSPLATLPPRVPLIADLRIGDQQGGFAMIGSFVASSSELISSCWVVMAPMDDRRPQPKCP
jgi:hypothetical protein